MQFKVVWSDGVREWQNVLHARYSTPPTFGVALANTVFNAVSSAFISSGWVSSVNSAVNLLRVEIKDLNDIHLPAYLSDVGPTAGSGLGTQAAANLAVEVSLRTARAGKEWVGRTYLGGLDSSVQNDAYSFGTGVGTAAEGFLDGIRTGLPSGLVFALAQRALQAGTDHAGNPLPPRDANAEPIIAVRLTDHRLDSQRRRLGR